MLRKVSFTFTLLLVLALLASVRPAVMAQAQGPVTTPPQSTLTPPADPNAPSTGTAPSGQPDKSTAVFEPAALPPGIDSVSAGYLFSSASGTYTEITGGTLVTSSCDDTSYGTYAIGYSFTFDSIAYTTFGIQCNGFIAMGASPSSSYTPISTGATNNIISALGGDLQTNTTNSEIRYEVLGSTPNQVLVVQYKNFRPYNATGHINNFQIRLYETSNIVDIVYGAFTVPASNTRQVGLRGASSADFNNRMTGTWDASLAGTANTSSMTLSSTSYPSSGQTYTWTPDTSPRLSTSTKSATPETVVGESIAYTIHVINNGAGPANNATLTDPLPPGTTYVIGSVSCTSGTCSYNAGLNQIEWGGVVPVGGNITISFQADTDGIACGTSVVNTATISDPLDPIGPVTKQATTVLFATTTPSFTESFDGTDFPPSGWTAVIVSGSYNWARSTAGTYPTIAPHSGAGMALYSSFNAGTGSQARLATPPMDLTAGVKVAFYMSHDTGYASNADRIQVQVSTDGGANWNNVGDPISRYDAAYTTPGWGRHTVDLSAYRMANVQIGFLAISAYGNNMYLDDVALYPFYYPCPSVSIGPDSSQSSCPLSTIYYPLTVQNNYLVTDTLDIAVTSIWPTIPSLSAIVLGPGASRVVTVTVDIPWDAAGSDTATVVATGQASGLSDSATLETSGGSYWVDETPAPTASTSMDNVVIEYNDETYLIGGYGMTTPAKYTPVTGAWTPLAAEPAPRIAYANDGCVGLNGSGQPVIVLFPDTTSGATTLHRYNIISDTWDSPAMPVELPASGIWAPDIVSDRANNVCYISGGATTPGAGNLNTLYAYYPATNTAAALAPMTSVRDFHASWLYNGMVCVGGGNNGVAMNSTQCFDITSGTWSAENATLGPLPYAIWGTGDAEQWFNGVQRLWIMGGVDAAGALTAQTSYFDTDLGAWVASRPLLHAVYRVEADVQVGEAYVVGGSTGGFTPTTYNQRLSECPPALPDVSVAPTSLAAEQCADTVTTQVVQVCNANGTAPLNWTLTEIPTVLNVAAYPTHSAPRTGKPVELSLSNAPATGSPAAPWQPDGPVQLVLDDGSRDNDIGIGGTWEFIWLNRFTPNPADFPFYIDQVSVWFSSLGMVNVGDDIVIVLYENTSGNTDPAVGSNLIASYNTTVQALDTWNDYTLPASVTYNGPGDVLVGVIALELPGTSYWPASMDQTTTQQRSWAGWWLSSPPPFPPTLPPDDTWILIDAYFPGNWMVRASGQTIDVADIPWLSESPITGTVWMGECQDITVTFDSTGLAWGDYFGNLVLASNDPDTSAITLPVTLTVDQPVNIVDVTVGTNDLTAAFTSTVSGQQPIDYLWDFGDGATSTEVNPSHTYAAGGSYDVTLDVTNGCGTDTWTGVVIVCDPVHAADFIWNPPTPIVHETAYFTATAAGTGPITYDWDFGDGSTDNGQYVNHAYSVMGTYTVVMTATGECGEPQVVTYDITIATDCVEPDGADFTWAPITPTVDATVSFSGTLEAGTGPLTWEWDFGDGSTDAGQNITHTYDAAGTYTVVLTVTNECGFEEVTYEVVVVEPCDPPTTADFTWAPTQPVTGQEVSFNATSDGSGPLTYEWDFGDGTTGSGQSVNHTFAAAGEYTIVLTVSNECGYVYGELHHHCE